MKDILRGIADSAGKGIYAVIHYYGTATFQDLIDCGYGESTIYVMVRKLLKGGLILKVGRGVYRDVTCSGQQVTRSIVQVPQPVADCGLPVAGNSLEQKSSKKAKHKTVADCGLPVADCG